jgi:SHAQKYF class myb-like DNA-binding protein
MKQIIELDEKSGRWSRAEHRKFIEGLKLYGRNWKKISEIIKTRTSTQVRSHAQKHFIREATVNQSKFELYIPLVTCEYRQRVNERSEVSTQYGEGMIFPLF